MHDPVLQWVDPTPTLTQGWTIWRIANPEGMSGTDPARTTWAWLGVTAAAQTWYADTTLPDGYTAQYVVRATVSTGVGPESNQVITGNRPATTVTRANGATTQVAVDWDVVVGATGYDVYRDGILARSVTTGSAVTWTDTVGQSGWTGDGYGHSHYYRVVPTNRWENRLTIGTDDGRLALGSALGDYPVGGARLVSAQSAASGDFTAPSRPTVSAAANRNRSSDVTWTAAAWTGSGPTTGRVTAWVVEYRSSNEPVSTLVTLGGSTFTRNHAGRPAGRWSEYRVTGRNASGDSPVSGFDRAWQRPAVPSCAGSSATTRSMVVTGSAPATVDETYTSGDFEVRGSGGWASDGATVDPLAHATTHTFHSRVNGAGGWSDEGSCTGLTLTLGVSITATSSTTRSVSANMATQYGSSSSLTLEGGRSDANVTGSTWDPLTHATTYTVTARNSDGFNNVVAQQNVATLTLGVQITAVSSTTRSVSANMATQYGSSSSLTLENVRTDNNVTGATWDPLSHATTYTVTARNSDGYNDVVAQQNVTTATLPTPPAPPAPGCSYAATDGTSPGSLTINAITNGRYRVNGGGWTAGRSWSGLGAGNYQGSTYRLGDTNSDGFNSVTGPSSGVSYCSTLTVVNPPPSWGSCTAGGAAYATMGYAGVNFSVVNLFVCGSGNIQTYDVWWHLYNNMGVSLGSVHKVVSAGGYNGSGSSFSQERIVSSFTGLEDAVRVTFQVSGSGPYGSIPQVMRSANL